MKYDEHQAFLFDRRNKDKCNTVEYRVIVSRLDLIECLSEPIPCRMRPFPANIRTEGNGTEHKF